MRDDLEQARELAHSLRFRAEGVIERPTNLARPAIAIRRGRQLGLEVSTFVTPKLAEVVASVCRSFGLSIDHVRTFVHPSADSQALCSIADDRCLIEVTSALVERLSDQEQAFVIGHELGHFLLDHHYLPLPAEGSIERYSLLRAREVSADRLGLVACNNPEAAIRAVIKSFSGLSDNHLRFDAAAFLRSCFVEDSRQQVQAGIRDTHPSFAVRARCLVHFSSIANMDSSQSWKAEFGRVEERVVRDFAAFGEAEVAARIEELETNVGQWLWILPLAASGTISKHELSVVENKFGAEFAQSIRLNFSSMSRREVQLLVDQHLRAGLAECRSALPLRAETIFKKLVEECEANLGLASGSHPAISLLK